MKIEGQRTYSFDRRDRTGFFIKSPRGQGSLERGPKTSVSSLPGGPPGRFYLLSNAVG